MIPRKGILYMVAATLLVTACDRKPPAPAQQWVPVRVEQAGTGAPGNAVRYSAVVTPKTQVSLAFKVGGYVESILQHPAPGGGEHPVTQGESVVAGTVMATLKDREYRDKVKSARADLDSAKAARLKADKDYKRAKALYKTGSMTGTDYDSAQQEYSTAQANVASAQAQLDDAELNLSYCKLAAPLDAVVLKRNVEVGDLVEPGGQAFALADMSSVKVLFAVPDVMLKQVAVGDTLSVNTRSYPGQTFDGTVTSISPVADSQTRVFDIELTLPNDKDLWKDGMVAALGVPAGAVPLVPTITVPISAVVSSRKDPDGYAVYVVDRQKDQAYARLRDVRLGQVQGNRVVVLDGLVDDEQVISSGINTVRDGVKVRVLH